VRGLENIADVRPVPAKQFYPNWWRKLASFDKESSTHTAKACPAFPDFFSQGFILPMWSDTKLEYDPETTFYRWEAGRGEAPYKWDTHANGQLVNHVDNIHHQGSKGKFVFKAISPWKIITPKGYSLLQLPVFYHFNNDFSVLPGILRTDTYHEINQQVLVHGEEKISINIPRGAPFVHYVPIKREDFDLDVHYATEEEFYLFDTISLDIESSKMGKSKYRKNFKGK
jgi:hypothetical protein